MAKVHLLERVKSQLLLAGADTETVPIKEERNSSIVQ